MNRAKLLIFLVIFSVLMVILFPRIKMVEEFVRLKMKGKKTVSDRVAEYGPIVDQRLSSHFQRVNVQYPPSRIVFIALKREMSFEVYANNPSGKFKRICSYPILAASGKLGPKLKEGDRQVPEGIYKIESLNPNSLFHLSMKVNYPNEFDRSIAQKEGRTDLGGDIMIHGNQVSIGCIALGDQASEDLFVLASKTGFDKIKVIISPVDFRVSELPTEISELPGWTNELYAEIKNELKIYE